MKFIKIYSPQRCGSNYLEWLLKNNFLHDWTLDEGNILGWKHGYPVSTIDWTASNWDSQPVPQEIKNKYLMKALPYKEIIQKAFDENQIIYLICTRNPYSWIFNKVDLEGNIQKWNEKNEILINFIKINNINLIIKHEELIIDPLKVLIEIQSKFQLERAKNFTNLENTIAARQTIKNETFDRTFFIEKKYIQKDKLPLINKLLDESVMNFLDYKYE